MEIAAAEVFVFQMLSLIWNCFEMPQNEKVAVFYYFAMCRPVILQVRNILKFGKAIPLGRKKEFYYCTIKKLFIYFHHFILCKEIQDIRKHSFFLAPFMLFPKEKHRALSNRRVWASLMASHLWCSNTTSTPLLTTSCIGGSDWAGLPGAKLYQILAQNVRTDLKGVHMQRLEGFSYFG